MFWVEEKCEPMEYLKPLVPGCYSSLGTAIANTVTLHPLAAHQRYNTVAQREGGRLYNIDYAVSKV